MITDELVSFETAKLAKEKGFNWICPHYFRLNNRELYKIFPCEDWSDIGDRINVPTKSLLQRWLREEKGFYVYPLFDNDELSWTYVVREKRSDMWIPLISKMSYYDCFDEAMEDALKVVLENLVI